MGLRAMINAEPDMEVCGEAADAATATADVMKLRPELVIVDISLRGNSGIELIKNIKAFDPGIDVVVVSMYDESAYALRALRAGAKAYVMKQDAAEKVILAIRAVRKGQLFVSPAVGSQMLNSFARGGAVSDESGVSHPTDRELEVLQLVGCGVSTRAIASRLNISIKTVETHRAHLKEKLNISTAPQLIQFAVRWTDKSKAFVPSTDQDEAERRELTHSSPRSASPHQEISARKSA
jgi:DNA-binding NarL/FixJ family response regulator